MSQERRTSRAASQASKALAARIDEELVIDKIVPGGRGLARLADGRVALVDGAFPGDRVRLPVARDRGGYVEGTAEMVQAGALRREPPCPVARACGGCDFMELPLETQQRMKLELVREALRRTARLELEEGALELESRGPALGYRTRIRLQLEGGRVGFYAAGSHRLVEVERCAVSAGPIQDALANVRVHARRHAAAFAPFSHVELRAAPGAERCSLRFAKKPGVRLEAPTRRAVEELRKEFLVAVQGERDGADLERFDLGEVYLLSAPGSFTQVNWAVNQALVDAVLEGAERYGAHSFIDLYCGSGNFSLPLLARGLVGKGIEVSEDAIACAARAATEQALAGGEFVAGDVSRLAEREAAAGRTYDLAVVDPPRKGAKDALSAVRRLASKAIVLIACDPVTFARDLRTLLDLGLSLERVRAFDMFPQTHHVECMAWLRVG